MSNNTNYQVSVITLLKNLLKSFNKSSSGAATEDKQDDTISKLEDIELLLSNDEIKQEQIRVLINSLGSNQILELQSIKGFVDELETGVTDLIAKVEEKSTTNTDAINQANMDIVSAINGQSNTNRQEVVGTDDGNGTTIIQIVDIINGVEQLPTYQNLDRSPYTLIGNFVTSSSISAQFQIIQTLLRATAMNSVAGYEVDNLIDRSQLIDVTTNTIINTSYFNTDTATNLITANVVETELSRRTDIPETINTVSYHVVETVTIDSNDVEQIQGIIYKVFQEIKN